MLANISGMARVLDAKTVVVGMQPAVAITLVELGITLPGIQMALNVEKGMDILGSSIIDKDTFVDNLPTEEMDVFTQV